MYKIVIADDERLIREGLKYLDWESNGMTIVAEAKNGVEAMEIINGQTFDILLTDIRMPGVTGIELAKYLQETNEKAKTILLSGYGEFSYAKQAILSGVFDYILKPSTPAEILEVTKKACEQIELEKKERSKVLELTKELQDYKKVMGHNIQEEAQETEIQNILLYIYSHYMEPLTLAELANYFHFNPVYLSTYIKKNTGRTFIEILTSIRMHQAAILLRTTRLKNGEVGAKVGIPDERYFGQVFKKIYKVTPFEYKKSAEKLYMPMDNWLEELEKKAKEK